MNKAWNRIVERKELWFHFEQGRNIAMFAPRRLGKTWLMKNLLLKEASNKGWCAIYCDLQNANTYKKAITLLIQDLQESADLSENLASVFKAKFKDALKGNAPTFKDIVALTDPEDLLDVVLASLNDNAPKKPVLIMLDEVTICASHIMKESPADGCLMLNTLRKVRDAFPAIRWMLTGSIGIDHFSKEHKVSGAFNNLHPFLIEPFAQQIASDFVAFYCHNHVAQPFILEAETHLYLQKRLGWLSPYYLEKLCLKIEPSAQVNGEVAANCADIDKACDSLLQHPNNQIFSGWPDHLERNIPAEVRFVCKAILGYLSENQDGESRNTIRAKLEPQYLNEQIREALIILKNDGFLKKDQVTDKFSFVMHLLADYWQEYRV